MRRSRRANPDRNQAAIVEALRAAGWLVASTTEVGSGFPDLLAFKPSTGVWKLIEVKQPNKPLKPSQVSFQEQGWRVSVVRSVDEALAL